MAAHGKLDRRRACRCVAESRKVIRMFYFVIAVMLRRVLLNRNHMNLSKLSQIIFVGICIGFLICGDANGQISGTGTTGSTAGSGTGTGSAGVMTGTGPDPSKIPTPYEQTITERMIVMPNTQRKKVRKRSKKIGNKTSTTRNAPAAAATAAPSPR